MRTETALLDETFERTATTPIAATIGCALRSTNGDREKSGAEELNNKQSRAASTLSVDGLQGELSAQKGRAETERGAHRYRWQRDTATGEVRRTKQVKPLAEYPAAVQTKARAFYAKKAALRKQPGNCGRCGKPNPQPEYRHCPKCREYQQQRKAALRDSEPTRSITSTNSHVLMCRVMSLEMRLAKVELELGQRRKAYRYIKRREAALLAKKRDAQARLDAMPRISKQELATINHAYDSRGTR